MIHGQAFSFREVERYMNLKYAMRDGTEMIVNLALVDSGDQTDDVYDFCMDNADWALPCKGASNQMQAHYRMSTVNKSNSKASHSNRMIPRPYRPSYPNKCISYLPFFLPAQPRRVGVWFFHILRSFDKFILE